VGYDFNFLSLTSIYMEKAQIEKLSPNQRSRIRNGKGCKCKMAGEGVPSDDVMLSHGNFQKLVKGAAKNKPVVLTLTGGEIEANATTGTGIMEGGKFSLFRKDLGLGSKGRKLKGALGRVADKAIDKGEASASDRISSMGSGMSGGSIGPRRSSVAPNIGAGGNLLCPMDSKPHLANFHMFTQLPPALVPSGMFGRGLYH
jgi:hypothetical protein